MDFHLDLINIAILTVVVLNSSLGLFVFLTKRANRINQFFFTFSLTATVWGLSIFFYRALADTMLAESFARILYASAAIIPFAFLFFIQVFPEPKYNLPKRFDLFLGIPFLCILLLTLIPHALILGVFKPLTGEPIIYFNSISHVIYAFYIVAYFSICYALLFVKYYKFTGIQKQQITYVILGTFVSTIIGISTNLLMPLLGDFRLNWMGQVGIIAMVGSISYSILRHKLFNVKVVATQFIVFVLCISLFVRLLLSSGRSDLIINAVFLAVTIIIGLLLVRSVINEVEQREKLEALTGDLEKANESLGTANQNLGKANADLAHANDRLKELDVMKSEFLSFATHQIRAPLTAIKGYASLLLEGDFGDISEPVNGAVKTIFQSCENLVIIVNEFLDISRIEQGRMKYTMTDFDVRALVEQTLNELRPNIEKAGIVATLDADAKQNFIWNGDQTKIKQIVGNIIDNAIKYTPSDVQHGLQGSIAIRLSRTAKKILIAVTDNGIGIAAADIPKLFEKFSRTKEANRQNVIGTGLGLFVAKQMIEAHKGKIWVESPGPGKGSTFFIELPVLAPVSTSTSASTPVVANKK